MTSSLFHRFRAHLASRSYLRAVAFMLASTAAFSAMNVAIRYLSADMHTTMIVLVRNVMTLLILLPFALRNQGALLKTRRMTSHFWRATIGIVGMQSWFYCIASFPLNHATALSFTAPLFTALFAVLFLKEKAKSHQLIALGTGFLGTLIILRPDPEHFEWGLLIVMFTTSLWAIAGMMVKSLTRTESALRIVFFMSLFMAVWSLPIALPFWQMPTPSQWPLLALVALFSTAAHFALVKAYSLAPVVEMMPFDFMRLIFTALFAYLVFHETSDLMTWLGAAVIVASTVFSMRRDQKAAPVASALREGTN